MFWKEILRLKSWILQETQAKTFHIFYENIFAIFIFHSRELFHYEF